MPLIFISCCNCVGVIDVLMLDALYVGRINSSFVAFLVYGNDDCILFDVTSVIYDSIIVITTSLLQHNEKQLEIEAFKDFDQVDDARCAIDENESRPFDDLGSFLENNSLNDSSKDLLRRLLEPNPRLRLKSLLALQRIAFFHNYNIDNVRQMKVSKNRVKLHRLIIRAKQVPSIVRTQLLLPLLVFSLMRIRLNWRRSIDGRRKISINHLASSLFLVRYRPGN